jgi:23S rRNA (guanosine2251-2'-O)-methyltransferase
VVGSEGHGLSPAIRRRCDLFVRIPMKGSIGSLNAAVAGSILLFEALGQRDPGARPASS